MKQNRSMLLAFVVMLGGCINLAAVEDRQDLGFGFHHDVIAQSTVNPSESIGHFDYLFYRNRKLSQSDKFAVAPSGAAIVYQDGPSGNIFVFRRKQNNITQLTSTFPGLVDGFVWHEGKGHIMALVGDAGGRKHWMKFVLPQGGQN
jgi:hypothetical protein